MIYLHKYMNIYLSILNSVSKFERTEEECKGGARGRTKERSKAIIYKRESKIHII